MVHVDPQIPGTTQATVELNRVDLTSSSGRGIVAVGGAKVTMKDCFLHECAATGLYVAGERTVVEAENSDIVGNGKGSSTGAFVPSGHSGIFAVEGQLKIKNCNISWNMGAGMSVMDVQPVGVQVDDQTQTIGNLGGSMSNTTRAISSGLMHYNDHHPRTQLMALDHFDGPRLTAAFVAQQDRERQQRWDWEFNFHHY